MIVAPKWSEEFSVGNDLLDSQHQDLFGLVGLIAEIADRVELTADDEALVARAFVALRRYVRLHFRDEERLMTAAGYADLLGHIEEHKAFVEWLDVLEDSSQQSGHSPIETVRHMGRYLADWLVGHVLGSDKRYAPYLGDKSKKTAA